MNRSQSQSFLHRKQRQQTFRPWSLTRFRERHLSNQNCRYSCTSSILSELSTIQPWTFRIGYRNRGIPNVVISSPPTVSNGNTTVAITGNTLAITPNNEEYLNDGSPPQSNPSDMSNNNEIVSISSDDEEDHELHIGDVGDQNSVCIRY